jgi:D-alanine transaminase
MPELAYVNGDILPIEKAVVPIEDRGYQFADAVYEGIASYNGNLFYLDAHLDRLERSMKALSFPAVSRDKIKQAILELLDASGIARAFIYLQISRGVAPRNHAFPEAADVQFVMTIRPVNEVPEKLKKEGAHAITIKDIRWGRCDIKTVQLLPNATAKQKALAVGAHDAIFVAEDGVVREATSSNVFIVENGKAVTHPLTPQILPGVTRLVVIDICREIDIPVAETLFKVEALYDAEEVFLTGTTTEVLPIVKVDDRIIGNGKSGPVSKKLLAALQERGNRTAG